MKTIKLWKNTEFIEKFNVLFEVLVAVIGWFTLGFFAAIVWAAIVVF